MKTPNEDNGRQDDKAMTIFNNYADMGDSDGTLIRMGHKTMSRTVNIRFNRRRMRTKKIKTQGIIFIIMSRPNKISKLPDNYELRIILVQLVNKYNHELI